MLAINPDECIDCGVCEPEFPAEAILADTDERSVQRAELNRTYSEKWPNITKKGEPSPDADDFHGVAHKFDTYFSPKPGMGAHHP